jgi:hypothetical protein
MESLLKHFFGVLPKNLSSSFLPKKKLRGDFRDLAWWRASELGEEVLLFALKSLAWSD